MTISNRNKELLIVANSFLCNQQLIIAGVVSASVFESIIEDFELLLTVPSIKKNYGVRIDTLHEEKIINGKIKVGLETAWNIRNVIMHPALKTSFHCDDVNSCSQKLLQTLLDLFDIQVEVDYEEKAKIEESRFPNMWLEIKNETSEPKQLTTENFSNLLFTAENYMRSLSAYLTKNCLNSIDNHLKFQPLSRVNYTSGYVWLSAVKEVDNKGKKYRSRIALPGLTVVFKPTGINVYVELPGKAKGYKNKYYDKILKFSALTAMLRKSPKLKNGKYVFFHTWWFADREEVGTVKEYLSCANKAQNLKKIRQKWRFEELINERLEEIKSNLVPITRNSFLIGRFYSREDCLGKYRENLHASIAQDFHVLNPILQEIYAMTPSSND